MKNLMNDNDLIYLSGEKLYGDDFSLVEIEKWCVDEAEGYADLSMRRRGKYNYVYHGLNEYHAYRFIRKRSFNEVLGIGSAYGDEFKPIAGNIRRITILDPSNAFSNVKEVSGTPCRYFKPNPSGNIPFASGYFDLITSLGVMHHIANVSHVMCECYRCLDKGGIMLLREPIFSMGDWRKPREGLTKRERGIPLQILDRIIMDAGFIIKRRALCIFPQIPGICNMVGVAAYNNYALTLADALLSKIFSWNTKYHRTKIYERFGPTSAYYILGK